MTKNDQNPGIFVEIIRKLLRMRLPTVVHKGNRVAKIIGRFFKKTKKYFVFFCNESVLLASNRQETGKYCSNSGTSRIVRCVRGLLVVDRLFLSLPKLVRTQVLCDRAEPCELAGPALELASHGAIRLWNPGAIPT